MLFCSSSENESFGIVYSESRDGRNWSNFYSFGPSENYSNPVSIEDIAAFVGISRSQLFRCFQRIAGISPKEYLTRYRIKKACQLLAQTSFSMTAIANSLGFENSLYFSKAFRKVQGVSPSEYRSQIQES